jgi:hypothetical protein
MNTLFKIALLATAAQAVELLSTSTADLQLAELGTEEMKTWVCKGLDMDVPEDAEECEKAYAKLSADIET